TSFHYSTEPRAASIYSASFESFELRESVWCDMLVNNRSAEWLKKRNEHFTTTHDQLARPHCVIALDQTDVNRSLVVFSGFCDCQWMGMGERPGRERRIRRAL